MHLVFPSCEPPISVSHTKSLTTPLKTCSLSQSSLSYEVLGFFFLLPLIFLHLRAMTFDKLQFLKLEFTLPCSTKSL